MHFFDDAAPRIQSLPKQLFIEKGISACRAPACFLDAICSNTLKGLAMIALLHMSSVGGESVACLNDMSIGLV